MLSPAGAAPVHYLRANFRTGRVEWRSDLDRDRLEPALDRVASGGEPLRALKRDLKASVWSGLSIDGRGVCLKIYSQHRRARRCFRTLRELWALGVPVPAPYFLWERTEAAGGGAAVGMEDLAPLREFDRWLAARLGDAAASGPSREAFGPVFRSLGAQIRDLHARGFVLDDLKTCNIFFAGDAGTPFRFVDVDGARRRRTVSPRLRALNLLQLNRSVPIAAGLSSRHAFWREYRRDLRPGEARKLRRAVIERSAATPGVLYVSDAGDQQEPWPQTARAWPR